MEVYNDQEFTSKIGKKYYPVGPIYLDSKSALDFVRERKSLAEGDNDRGKNQEKVMAAIIDKLTSTEALQNHQAIIATMQNSVQTNIDMSLVMELINSQLQTGESYTITSQAITGTERLDLPSFARPDTQTHMMEINQESLEQARQAIQATMQGNE